MLNHPRTRIWPKVLGLVFFLLVFGIASPPLFSQRNAGTKVKPLFTAKIDIVEIERREKASGLKPARKKPENEVQIPPYPSIPKDAKGETFRVTPRKSTAGTHQRMKTSPSTIEPSFPAIGDNGSTIPPDMGGAAGPNHLMTTLNSEVQVQDKTGLVISKVTLEGFFSPLVGSASCQTPNGWCFFDPRVLYDPFAGRWIMTAAANSWDPTRSALAIAVSSSSDPTNPWTAYAFQPVDATYTNWIDYPMPGFNKNWVVVSGSLITTGSAFSGARLYIFDKAALYAGSGLATVVTSNSSGGYMITPAITLDNSTNTEYLLRDAGGQWPVGINIFVGRLQIYTITGTPSSPIFTATLLYPNVNDLWYSTSQNYLDIAPQNTIPQKIHNGESSRLSVVFQNGSLWCAHTVFLPPITPPAYTAVQWWQVDPITATVQQFGRVEDPTGNNFYAMPSIGVNSYNDVLLGYSSFSATQWASANYSLRLHTDPPNTMQTPVQFKAGLAPYYKTGGGRNRWGDYSSTYLDSDSFSFWTLQQYAEQPPNLWGTEWNRVVPPVPNLYMQDRPNDLGAEPNLSASPMWESEDIWLRQTQDSAHNFAHITENAEYRVGTSNPNYVYVDVRNRGGAQSAGTEQLTLYWAKASSGLSWPDPWNGGVYFDPGPNTMLMGKVIGITTLPVIPPGGEYVHEFAWDPPDPAVYAAAFGNDTNHFCLLARVTSGGGMTSGMTFPETADLNGNVLNNNRIVWKNIGVYDLLPGAQLAAHAVIANLTKRNMNVKLKFTTVDADGRPLLPDNGMLIVRARGRLRDILRRNQAAGDGVRYAPDGTYQVVKDGGFLQRILLKPNDYGTLEVVFVPRNAAERMNGYAVTITQLEQVKGTDRIIGGQTFVFGTVRGFGTSPGRERN